MSALTEVPVYWLNFLLHTALVSGFVWVACLLVRDPRRRAFASALGVLATVSLPWVSALRPFAEARTRVMEIAPVSGTDASGWTIRVESIATVQEHAAPVVMQDAAQTGGGIGWAQVLLGLWTAGSAVGFAGIALRQWRVVRWNSRNRALTDEDWQAIAGIGIERRRISVCGEMATPCVIGFFRRRVVLPAFLLENPTDPKLVWALRHEAEHFRSGDSRVAVLLSCAVAVMWWNPSVRYLCGRWAEDRERVCDARATEDGTGRREYGRFLLDLSGGLPLPMKGAVPMAGSAAARRMKKRLQAILRGDRMKENSLMFRFTSCLLIGCAGLLTGFTGIERAAAVELATPPVVEAAPVAGESPAPPPVVAGEIAAPAPETGAAPAAESAGERAERMNAKPPNQVKLTSKLILTREGNPDAGRVLDDARIQLMLRDLSQLEGTELLTTPSVMAKTGQRAMVEIVRQGPPLPGVSPDSGDSRDFHFLGLSLDFVPEVVDGRIKVGIDCRFHFPPGSPSLLLTENGSIRPVPKDFDWETVKAVSAKATKELKSGETMVVPFEGVEKGWHLTGLFTAMLIDATGRPFDPSGKLLPQAWELPPVWRDGSVKVRGAIVELPQGGKLDSYWFEMGEGGGLVMSLYPNDHLKQIAREAREAGGEGRWKDLGTTVVRSGQPVKPWAEFPLEISDVKRSQKIDCQMRIKLPDAPEKEIAATGYCGYILGCELAPTTDGRRRILLLALDEVK